MPTGRPDVIPVVIDLLMRRNPASILDVGAGFGKWGLLLREYLEVWQGRLTLAQWQKRIDAVECFEPYAELPWYPLVYNHVYRTRIENRPDLLEQYDVILLADVIEHLEWHTGKAVLDACPAYIITTPGYYSPQSAGFGNDAETHRSRWMAKEFAESTTMPCGMIVGWKL